MAISLVLVGCAQFEEYDPEKYSAGPSVTIGAELISDSTFVLTLTPASGTSFYAYAVEQADEPTLPKGIDLIKGVYKGIISDVLKAADKPDYTHNMRNAKTNAPLLLPNTTYQIYAVASSDKGVLGEVVSYTVTTTDGLKPAPKTYSRDARAAKVTFSETLVRGEGKVTATYYKEFDIVNTVSEVLNEEDIIVEGNAVTFNTPDAHDGAFVCISWEEGAFKDLFGNLSNPFNSRLDMTTGQFRGIYYRVPTVEFEIADKCFVSPAIGEPFSDWEAFTGKINLGENVYAVDEDKASGDIKVIYSSDVKKSYHNLSATDWNVADSIVTFKLPVEPDFGDNIAVNIAESVIYDVWGNPNAAYTNDKAKWLRFAPTKEMLLGNFDLLGVSANDGKTYKLGSGTIEEDTENANGLILNDYVIKGSVMVGAYDLSKAKMYLAAFDSLGNVTIQGTEYELYNYNVADPNADLIAFDINPDSTMTSNEYSIVAYDFNAGKLYFYIKLSAAGFYPTSQPAQAPRNFMATSKYKMTEITNPALKAKILRKIKKR